MTRKNIGIIDVGLGNVKSLISAIRYCGFDYSLVSKPMNQSFDLMILPGVGAYKEGMKRLHENNLIQYIREYSITNPILGICLGMQLMGRSSTEGGSKTNGLELLDFDVVSLRDENWNRNKLPNIGFIETDLLHPKLFHGFNSTYPFYYIHSYVISSKSINPSCVVSSFSMSNQKYITGFCSGNYIGVQFHPEKSHKFALKLFTNILS